MATGVLRPVPLARSPASPALRLPGKHSPLGAADTTVVNPPFRQVSMRL